jgi:hypothetical protein
MAEFVSVAKDKDTGGNLIYDTQPGKAPSSAGGPLYGPNTGDGDGRSMSDTSPHNGAGMPPKGDVLDSPMDK